MTPKVPAAEAALPFDVPFARAGAAAPLVVGAAAAAGRMVGFSEDIVGVC